MNNTVSTRAEVVTRRTYCRPKDEAGQEFESWEEVVDRVMSHQRWLWQSAIQRHFKHEEEQELEALRRVMLQRQGLLAGRTLWLGGTDVARRRQSSMFNCSGLKVETVHDVVDMMWLLLQGCGVGFEPTRGVLSGFAAPLELEIIPSTMTMEDWNNGMRGDDRNREKIVDGVWTIRIGDSAEAWAKAVGKVLANKQRVHRLILDFSQIRPAGVRLKGYGWISSGHETFAAALEKIVEILNQRSDQLLTRIDILDILNLLGTTLSSRRSAEIALVPFNDPEWEEFALAKKDSWKIGKSHRGQSNNALVFYQRPSKLELRAIFDIIKEGGGSEPSFINGEAAQRRAPWWKVGNPCNEISLGNKSFCNLTTVDLAKFNGDFQGLKRVIRLLARANYRQTCVDLDDGILQRTWHELNEHLRLTGVSLTGFVRWEGQDNSSMLEELKQVVKEATDSMADELKTPRSKAQTTIKPEGTASKVLDTTEGCHKPLGKYIFNWINFSEHDPMIPRLEAAGYIVMVNPYDSTGRLVKFPVSYEDVAFETVKLENGREVEVNTESAITQLERYKFLLDHYVDKHNVSNTISYSEDEVPEMIEWIYENWDHYVGVSFIYRNDPTKTAEDLGYPYLPQSVATREEYEAYLAQISPVDLNQTDSLVDFVDESCATGACPVK